MSTYYWVGGSGTWNSSTTTNWASSSGGTGGAGVPTSTDNVIFDNNSNVGTGTFTVTASGGVCNDMSFGTGANALDGNMTFSNISGGVAITVYGNMTLPTITTRLVFSGGTGATSINFSSTSTGKTITTNGITIATWNIIFDGVGGGWTLGSALAVDTNATTTGIITLTNGSLNTNGFAVSCTTFNSNNSNIRTLTLGSSTFTATGSSFQTAWSVNTTNLTLNSGTSSLVLGVNSTGGVFAGGGLTYYNINFQSSSSSYSITGSNIFNNFTTVSSIILSNNQTINGTFSAVSPSPIGYSRIQIQSDTFAIARVLTIATLGTLTDVDFQDIIAAGASISGGNWTGTRLGNWGGNSNITFATPKTVYWNLTGTVQWGSANAWAATPAGTPAPTNFPLPQDTATFTDSGAVSNITLGILGINQLPSIDMSSRTVAFTLNFSAGTTFYGDVKFFPALNFTATAPVSVTFSGRKTQVVLGAFSWSSSTVSSITLNSPSGILQLAGNWTVGATFTHTAGTLNLQSYTLTPATFASSNSNTRTIAFGTGNINVINGSGTVWDTSIVTNLTVTGAAQVNCTTAGARTISPGSLNESNSISFAISGGAGAVTISSGSIKSLDFTGFTGTLGSSTGALTIYGNLILVAGMTQSATAALTFAATSTGKTITSAGKSLNGAITFSGVGGGWTLQDALTSTNTITITNGSLNTNGFSVTASAISSNNSNTRSLTLGASTITLSATSTNVAWDITTSTGMTLSSGTSTINLSGTNAIFQGGSLTYYNVSKTLTNTGFTIGGTNSFNNLSVSTTASTGITPIIIGGNQTIAGTFTISTPSSAITRFFLQSDTLGTVRTITAAVVGTFADIDFRDITAAGASGTWSGTRLGNCGNNTNITFAISKTVYWNLTGLVNWSATAWATSSGGSPAVANFPLPQDTAVFDNSGSASTVTINANWNIGTISASTRTTAMTLATGTTTPTFYGNFSLGTGITISGTGNITFAGGTGVTQTINSAGIGLTQPITITSFGGTVNLAAALTTSNTLTLTAGTFGTANFALTTTAFSSTNTNTRVLNLGSSTFTVTTTNAIFDITIPTNMTLNAGTSTILFNGTSSGITTFNGGGFTYYTVTFGGAGSLTTYAITGANTYTNFNINISTGTSIGITTIGANQTITGTLTSTKTGTNPIGRRLIASNSIGTARTITAASVSGLSYLDFRDITAAGASGTWSGTSFGNCGNNTNITFSTPKTVYWNLTGSVNWSATAWATSSGGTPAVANFPLAQDTAVFDNSGSASTITVEANWNIGTINMSTRTTPFTFATNTITPYIYGSVTLFSGLTLTGTGGVIFLPYSSQTLTSNGISWTQPLSFNGFSNTTLGSALTSSSFYIGSGTFNANNYNVTSTSITIFGGTVNMGSGTWTATGNGSAVWNAPAGTINANSSTIAMSSSTAKGFIGGGQTYYNLVQTGTGTLTISGNNTFNNITNTVQPTTITFTSSSNNTFTNFSLSGTAGNLVTINSSTTTQHTLTMSSGTVSVNYCNISYSNAIGGAVWNALTSNGNVNGGNNSGWLFALISTILGQFFAFF